MRCRLLTPPLERASRVWGINSPNASIYWLMEGICGHWPSKSWSRQRGARPKSSGPKAAKKGVELRMPIYVYILIYRQAFSMKNNLLSAIQIAALKKRFERCKTQILALEWVTQGSLSQSPQGNWRWTRKLKAKTVTVALSDKQAELFRLAIDGHRELENLIDQMRAISQQVLLDSVEGPPRRKRRISSEMRLNFAPFAQVDVSRLIAAVDKLTARCTNVSEIITIVE